MATKRRTTTDRTVWSMFRSRVNSQFIRSLPYWLPTVLLVGILLYGSIAWNVVISLTDYEGFGVVSYTNLDIEQYTRAFTSPEFMAATRNTFVLLVVFTAICLVVGLLLAIFFDQQIRFHRSLRMIYLYPFSLSFIVTAQVWLWLYGYNSGLVNITISAVGITPPHWLGDPQFVLAAIIIAIIWQFSGFTMVVYLAGLRAIPTDQFEAAKVDGASMSRIYRRIVIPQLRASTVSAAVVLMVFALKAFNFLYSMFGSYQPPKGADILAMMMMREAFRKLQWAYGAAIAVILFLLAMAVISPYLYSQYRRGEL